MQQGFSLVVRRKDVRPGGRERAKVIPVGGTVPPEVWALGLEVLEQGGLAAIFPGVDVDAQVQELLEERNPVVCRLWREPRRRKMVEGRVSLGIGLQRVGTGVEEQLT